MAQLCRSVFQSPVVFGPGTSAWKHAASAVGLDDGPLPSQPDDSCIVSSWSHRWAFSVFFLLFHTCNEFNMQLTLRQTNIKSLKRFIREPEKGSFESGRGLKSGTARGQSENKHFFTDSSTGRTKKQIALALQRPFLKYSFLFRENTPNLLLSKVFLGPLCVCSHSSLLS